MRSIESGCTWTIFALSPDGASAFYPPSFEAITRRLLPERGVSGAKHTRRVCFMLKFRQLLSVVSLDPEHPADSNCSKLRLDSLSVLPLRAATAQGSYYADLLALDEGIFA